jgi:hypothetical protein
VRRFKLADLEQLPKGNDVEEGAPAYRFSTWGVEIALGAVRHPRTIELALDSNDVYKLVCIKLGVALAERKIPPVRLPDTQQTTRTVALDHETARRGCDTLRIFPMSADRNYSIGHVALLDELSGAELEPVEPPASETLPSVAPTPKLSPAAEANPAARKDLR